MSMDSHRFSSFSDELQKLGAGNPEKPRPPKQPQHPAKTLGKTMAGTGAGMITGYGVGRAIEAIARKKNIPLNKIMIGAIAGAGAVAGLSYPLLKAYEQNRLEEYARKQS